VGGGLGTFLAGHDIDHYGFLATIWGTAAALAAFTTASWRLLPVISRQ